VSISEALAKGVKRFSNAHVRFLPRKEKRMRAFTLLVVSLTAMVAAASAFGHFDSGEYTHASCAGTEGSRRDPVNVVFWNWGTIDRSVAQVQSHTGWTIIDGSFQYFFDHSTCYGMANQRASGYNSRFHLRFHPIHHDDGLGWTTTADVHHEDDIWYCGHAVDSNGPNGSGFDQGRREVRIRMENAGHGWWSEDWDNQQNFEQCDGDYARSDGYVVFINMHQINH